MKRHAKPIIALASGAILLSGSLCQTAQATLIAAGTSILAGNDGNGGTTTGSEALTVSWTVTEDLSDIYTYSYNVNNPSGDIVITTPITTAEGIAGNPEVVDSFSVDFNVLIPGALVSTPTGGIIGFNDGSGVAWSLPGIAPNTSSGPLTFESLLAPYLGNASASDADPPSPWGSVPGGQQVAVPGITGVSVPEPTTLISGALLLVPFGVSTLRVLRRNRTA
jgi:hypothetical protein